MSEDNQRLNLFGMAVFGLIILYLIMNRAIPDLMVVPIGISIRPYEIVLMLILAAWTMWMVTDPHPLPTGLVGLVGFLLIAALVLAPFLNALNVNRFQANGAERGIVKLILFAGLFLAAYHIGYHLKYAKAALAAVIGVSVAQALLGILEYSTRQPLIFMFDLARSMGLIFDPNAVRSERTFVFTRFLTGEIRAAGLAPHPIVLSAIIALALLLMGIWFVYARSSRGRLLIVVGATILMIALPTPNSRTGFVILGLCFFPLMVLMMSRFPRVVLLAFGFVVALSVGFILSPETPKVLLDSVFQSEDDASTQARIERFDVLPDLLEPRPIVGAGYLTHDTDLQLFDNAYYMALIEFGILGLVLTVWWFLICLVRAWSATARAAPDDAILTACGVAAVLALLVGAATFDAWTFEQFLPMSLIVIGLGVGRSDVVLRRWRIRSSTQPNQTGRTGATLTSRT